MLGRTTTAGGLGAADFCGALADARAVAGFFLGFLEALASLDDRCRLVPTALAAGAGELGPGLPLPAAAAARCAATFCAAAKMALAAGELMMDADGEVGGAFTCSVGLELDGLGDCALACFDGVLAGTAALLLDFTGASLASAVGAAGLAVTAAAAAVGAAVAAVDGAAASGAAATGAGARADADARLAGKYCGASRATAASIRASLDCDASALCGSLGSHSHSARTCSSFTAFRAAMIDWTLASPRGSIPNTLAGSKWCTSAALGAWYIAHAHGTSPSIKLLSSG